MICFILSLVASVASAQSGVGILASAKKRSLGQVNQLTQKQKVVLIIADGIPADVIERLGPAALGTIIKKGVYTRAYVGGKKGTYTETPTISAPGYMDMLTGTWAYKHHVLDNEDQHPNYHYPSIFGILKKERPEARIGIFSTWLENRKTLLGAGLPETNNLHFDYAFDGYEKDSLRFVHDTASLYLHHIDDFVVRCADSVIRKEGPDLSWVYLEYTDDVGHKMGTGKAFDKAVGLLDVQLSKIDSAIRYREANYPEKWLLIITTDHGRDSITGADHGNQSARERTTWIVLNKKITNTYFKYGKVAMVDILPSVAAYMKIPLRPHVSDELDGTPFIGPVSLTNASVTSSSSPKGNQTRLTIRWKSFHPSEHIKLFISYTDNAQTGGIDKYTFLGSAFSGKEVFFHTVAGLHKQSFFKILLKGKYNAVSVRNAIVAR